MYVLGIVRIAFGILVVAWSFSLLPNMLDLFGPDGVAPAPESIRYGWGLLHVWNNDTAVWIVWALLLVGGIALTLGWRSRVAALLVFVCILSFQRRDVWVFNSGDFLLRIEAFFLVLAPSGAALSLDRLRTAGSFWSAQVRSPWVIRLLQIQVSIIYLDTVRDKLAGTTWTGGTAVSYALRLIDLNNFPTPTWLSMSPLIVNVATWGTLLIELALGVLVWNRKLRPWVLAAGVILHLLIMVSLVVAFFSLAVFVLYLAFIPPETAQGWIDRRRPSAAPTPVVAQQQDP
ncbi:hypothetical protein FOY51_22545 [Antrihabitans cavernicola]|uniref:HTTM-like domain-containing protein n=2 Tax=Antrihabitans cavernicola TaxID=2495913 RepID=A0A5A7S3M4_9NOCA|nr:hypothetical protein FOY51_22545 [Spelaeibacter cavernicola]